MLKEMDLCGIPIGDAGAESFAQALVSNTTLKTLTIGALGGAGLNAIALNAIASCLPGMHGLKSLTVKYLIGLTTQCMDSFLNALERNTELEHVYLTPTTTDDSWLLAEIMPQVKHQMALNRGGKRILKSESHVPASLWPRILARMSNDPDGIFFFLREKPDVLINKPPARVSRKRKRGWLNGLFGRM